MRINTQSAKSLFYLAIILLVIGAALGAPIARTFVFALAAFCAAVPALFADGRLRLFAAGVALLAALVASMSHLAGDAAYDAYRQRGRASAPAAPAAAAAATPAAAEAPQR